MSHAPSTFGSMTTSSLLPTAATIAVISSSIHGEFSALMRVHNPVSPNSHALAMAMKPERAASLASAGTASSRLPSTTSTCRTSSGTRARTFSLCGGTKWIIRSSRGGSSRSGAGAPIANGLKKLRGSFMRLLTFVNNDRRSFSTPPSRFSEQGCSEHAPMMYSPGDPAPLVLTQKLSDDCGGCWELTLRIGVIAGIFALSTLASCASGGKTTQSTPDSIPEMAKYNANVGKDYWVHDEFFSLCVGATSIHCDEFITVGTHFKIDSLVPNQSPDGRPIFDPYYHITLD